MKNNRVNLLVFCALSSILSVSDSLQAMETMTEEEVKMMTPEVRENVEKLFETNECEFCNFSWVHLKEKKFEGANLYATQFKWALLSNTIFRGADLRAAKFEGANLSGADLSGADLSGANFEWVILGGANLYEADLRGASLYMAADMTDFPMTAETRVIMSDEKIIESGAILDENTKLPSGKKYQP